jgi:hypothetical protein
MNCQSVRRQLNALIDGERDASAARVAALGHCIHCAECRAAWRSLRTQRAVARSLPLTPAPDRLKERTMTNLPIPSAHRAALSRIAPWLARATVGVALIVALAIFLPGRGPRAIAAAEVAAAVQRANTWHLKGWKLRDGKRIPWEVWGRRQPFFYREQFGDNLVIDDGQQRLETLPASGPGRGMALRLPSGEAPTDTWWSMLAAGNGWLRRQPWKETEELAIFRGHDSAGATAGYAGEIGGREWEVAGDSYYTIEKRTALPVRYEYRAYRQDAKFAPVPGSERLVETLDAKYDVPLPEAVTRPALPIATAASQPNLRPSRWTRRDRCWRACAPG